MFKGAHSATNCNKITDHHKWVEYIKKEGLCFNCLAKHRVAQWTSCNGCKQCTCKHHTSICKAYSYRPPLTNAQPSIQSSQSTKTCIPDHNLTHSFHHSGSQPTHTSHYNIDIQSAISSVITFLRFSLFFENSQV